MEEVNPLKTIIKLNYANKPVRQLEEEVRQKVNGFDKNQKWYANQIYIEIERYIAHKLDAYGFNNEGYHDELALSLINLGKSLFCQSTYDYILRQAKLDYVSPQKYIDKAFATEKPQGIISFLIPDSKQVTRA